MNYQTLRATITLHTALGTPMAGDTLFGQLCWALAENLGQDQLSELLNGYVSGKPYIVVSDAMPHGYIPLPTLPNHLWCEQNDAQRKALKEKTWLALENLNAPLPDWKSLAKSEAEIFVHKPQTVTQVHNSINRVTGTTGEGAFAPYQMTQIWYSPEAQLDVYFVFDDEKISIDTIQTALVQIGQMGFGRDASIGLGKFSLNELVLHDWQSSITQPSAYLCLAPCAPQGLGLDGARSYYQPLTRFGRHGNRLARSGQPFKKPILMAKTGAYFTIAKDKVETTARPFIGQGIAGISLVQNSAVHQGYAPTVALTAIDA